MKMSKVSMLAVLSLGFLAHVSARYNLPNPSNKNNLRQLAASSPNYCGSSPCPPPPPPAALHKNVALSNDNAALKMEELTGSSPTCGHSPCAPPPPTLQYKQVALSDHNNNNNVLTKMEQLAVPSPSLCGSSPCPPPPPRPFSVTTSTETHFPHK